MKEIIYHLEEAIKAHEKDLSLFPSKDYSTVPPEREKEIMDCCSI